MIRYICLYNSIASYKAFIRWWCWVQAWFRDQSIITTSPVRPAVSPNTSRLWQIFVTLWDCHIHANAVRALYIYIYICIYIYIYIIKLSGKVDKSNIYNWFTGNISIFIYRTSSDKNFFSFSYFQEIDKMV